MTKKRIIIAFCTPIFLSILIGCSNAVQHSTSVSPTTPDNTNTIQSTETHQEIEKDEGTHTKEYSTALDKINGYYDDVHILFLFNRDSNGDIYFAKVSPGNEFPTIKHIQYEANTINPRISIVNNNNTDFNACLMVGRSTEAIEKGFKPLDRDFGTLNSNIHAKYPGMPSFPVDCLIDWIAFGYDNPDISKTIKCGLQKNNMTQYQLGTSDIKENVQSKQIDFSIDEMFSKEPWCLIDIFYEWETSQPVDLAIDYTYENAEPSK